MKFEGIPCQMGVHPLPKTSPVDPTSPPHPQKQFFQFLVLGPGTYLTRSGPKFHAGGWSRFVKPMFLFLTFFNISLDNKRSTQNGVPRTE